MRVEPGYLTDSDRWEQRAQGADPPALWPWPRPPLWPWPRPQQGPLPTCIAVWYLSSFWPKLTELAGSLMLALRGGETGQDTSGETPSTP